MDYIVTSGLQQPSAAGDHVDEQQPGKRRIFIGVMHEYSDIWELSDDLNEILSEGSRTIRLTSDNRNDALDELEKKVSYLHKVERPFTVIRRSNNTGYNCGHIRVLSRPELMQECEASWSDVHRCLQEHKEVVIPYGTTLHKEVSELLDLKGTTKRHNYWRDLKGTTKRHNYWRESTELFIGGLFLEAESRHHGDIIAKKADLVIKDRERVAKAKVTRLKRAKANGIIPSDLLDQLISILWRCISVHLDQWTQKYIVKLEPSDRSTAKFDKMVQCRMLVDLIKKLRLNLVVQGKDIVTVKKALEYKNGLATMEAGIGLVKALNYMRRKCSEPKKV